MTPAQIHFMLDLVQRTIHSTDLRALHELLTPILGTIHPTKDQLRIRVDQGTFFASWKRHYQSGDVFVLGMALQCLRSTTVRPAQTCDHLEVLNALGLLRDDWPYGDALRATDDVCTSQVPPQRVLDEAEHHFVDMDDVLNESKSYVYHSSGIELELSIEKGLVDLVQRKH